MCAWGRVEGGGRESLGGLLFSPFFSFFSHVLLVFFACVPFHFLLVFSLLAFLFIFFFLVFLLLAFLFIF